MKYLLLATLFLCSCDRFVYPMCTEKEKQERKEYLLECYTKTTGDFCAGRSQEIFRCNPDTPPKEQPK